MAWIDLSHPIESGMPVYPGDPAVTVDLPLNHARDGVQLSRLSLGSHTGTHLDAPRHFLAEGPAIDQLPLDRFITEAWVAACPPGPAGLIDLTRADLTGMRPGDALLLATGWDKRWGMPAFYLDNPLFAPGSADLLLGLGIRLLGMDLPSASEEHEPTDTGAMHRHLLGSGVILVEGLTGLAPLCGRRVHFLALPLRLIDGDGSPVRACASVIDD